MTAPLTLPGIAPSTLRPLDFATDMDARLAWENVNTNEMNVVIPIVDAAVAAAPLAIAAAAAAVATSNAAAWVSGQAYAAGANAISQIDFQTYRASSSITSATDPYNDPAHWVQLNSGRQRAVPLTSAYTITAQDVGKEFLCTGTFTISFAPTSGLGPGWWCRIQNVGTGKITLDPNSSETLDSLTSYVMYARERRHVYIDETSTLLKSSVLRPFYMPVLAGFNFTVPPGYSLIDWDAVGGPGGAGSGRKGAAGSARTGGMPGGTPLRVRRQFAGLVPGTVIAIGIGAAGTSGAAQTVDSTNGNPGADGGNTTFGTLCTAYGGVGGLGGIPAGTTFSNTAGSGLLGKGAAAFSGVNGYPAPGGPSMDGQYQRLQFYANTTAEFGGASAGNGVSGNSIYGGAGSSADMGSNSFSTGGSSISGIAGAGVGGWIISSSSWPPQAGYAGALGVWYGSGATGGTCGPVPTAGANGAANAGTDLDMGNSGGGGGSTDATGVNGQKGGDGSFPAGAPGGGGACVNGAGNSGPGGVGQPGRAILRGVM